MRSKQRSRILATLLAIGAFAVLIGASASSAAAEASVHTCSQTVSIKAWRAGPIKVFQVTGVKGATRCVIGHMIARKLTLKHITKAGIPEHLKVGNSHFSDGRWSIDEHGSQNLQHQKMWAVTAEKGRQVVTFTIEDTQTPKCANPNGVCVNPGAVRR